MDKETISYTLVHWTRIRLVLNNGERWLLIAWTMGSHLWAGGLLLLHERWNDIICLFPILSLYTFVWAENGQKQWIFYEDCGSFTFSISIEEPVHLHLQFLADPTNTAFLQWADEFCNPSSLSFSVVWSLWQFSVVSLSLSQLIWNEIISRRVMIDPALCNCLLLLGLACPY